MPSFSLDATLINIRIKLIGPTVRTTAFLPVIMWVSSFKHLRWTPKKKQEYIKAPQCHPRSLILAKIESPYYLLIINNNLGGILPHFRDCTGFLLKQHSIPIPYEFWGVHLHLHLSSSCPLAHKASVQRRHSVRSFATCLAWFHNDHPMLFLSVSAVLLQLTLGRPIFLFPSGAQVIATWQWSSLSLLSMWPSQSHLRFRTSLLISLPLLLLSSSLLLTTFGQKTL